MVAAFILLVLMNKAPTEVENESQKLAESDPDGLFIEKKRDHKGDRVY